VLCLSQSRIFLREFAPFFFGRKHGVFCVLGFYIDDSADHKRKTVFSVAGFVGEGEDWFDVERFWNARLEREGLDYFRTYDCVNLENHFRERLVDRHGLNTARVIADAVLSDLKQLVATSNLYAYCLGVLMDDYRLVASEPDGQIVLNEDPYIFAHHLLMGLVLDDVNAFPRREIIAFMYDNHSKAALLQDSWAGFQEQNPNWAHSAGTLAPLDDKTNAAIQVADLIAHSTTRFFLEFPNDPEAKAKLKGWLKGNLQRVVYVDARWLRELVAENIDRFRALGAKAAMIKVPPKKQ
jgi:Protein of unknown function (DUF3800)